MKGEGVKGEKQIKDQSEGGSKGRWWPSRRGWSVAMILARVCTSRWGQSFQLARTTLNYCRHNRADAASAPILDGYRHSPACAFRAAVIDTVFRPVTRMHAYPVRFHARVRQERYARPTVLVNLRRWIDRDKQIHQSGTETKHTDPYALARLSSTFYLAESQTGYYFCQNRDISHGLPARSRRWDRRVNGKSSRSRDKHTSRRNEDDSGVKRRVEKNNARCSRTTNRQV